jgi:hypothetical protein
MGVEILRVISISEVIVLVINTIPIQFSENG